MPRLAFRNTGVLVMERLLFIQIRQYRIAVVVKRVISQLILPPPFYPSSQLPDWLLRFDWVPADD